MPSWGTFSQPVGFLSPLDGQCAQWGAGKGSRPAVLPLSSLLWISLEANNAARHGEKILGNRKHRLSPPTWELKVPNTPLSAKTVHSASEWLPDRNHIFISEIKKVSPENYIQVTLYRQVIFGNIYVYPYTYTHITIKKRRGHEFERGGSGRRKSTGEMM